MRFVEFRDAACGALRRRRHGLTGRELREKLDLPYERPCPTWVQRLEKESGLRRAPGPGRSHVWTIER